MIEVLLTVSADALRKAVDDIAVAVVIARHTVSAFLAVEAAAVNSPDALTVTRPGTGTALVLTVTVNGRERLARRHFARIAARSR